MTKKRSSRTPFRRRLARMWTAACDTAGGLASWLIGADDLARSRRAPVLVPIRIRADRPRRPD